MADNDQPSRLEAATIKAEAGSDIVYRVANLPADQTVATDSGNIPTLAGVLDYVQNEGDAAAADVRAKADAQVQAAIGTLVKKSGDTMTGALTLSGNPTANLHASPKQFVDAGDAKALADAKTYTDQKFAAIPAVVSKYYESAATPFTASQSISFPHSLGKKPKMIMFNFVVTQSVSGFSVGDIIEISPQCMGSNTNGQPIFVSFYDATNLTISFNSQLNISIVQKAGGAANPVVASQYFNIVARAIA